MRTELLRMKEEDAVEGRGGAELGRSAAQFTELNSASPASRGVPGSSGENGARGSGRAADADASLGGCRGPQRRAREHTLKAAPWAAAGG